MTARLGTASRRAALAAALLLAAGSMAPAFAQATGGGATGATGAAPSTDTDRMTGAREPRPGETQGATVSTDLLWPECADVRGQSARMVECLNLQQLQEVAKLTNPSRRQ